MDIFPKFIIENECLILGKVTYHNELMQTDDRKNVIGGGFYEYNYDDKTFIFFGTSSEFGKAKIDQIKTVIFNNKVYTDVGFMMDKPLNKDLYTFIYRSKYQGDIILS